MGKQKSGEKRYQDPDEESQLAHSQLIGSPPITPQTLENGKTAKMGKRSPGSKKEGKRSQDGNKSIRGFDLGTIPEVQNSPALGAEEEDEQALDAFRQAERLSLQQVPYGVYSQEEARDGSHSRNTSKYMDSHNMTERTKKRQEELKDRRKKAKSPKDSIERLSNGRHSNGPKA